MARQRGGERAGTVPALRQRRGGGARVAPHRRWRRHGRAHAVEHVLVARRREDLARLHEVGGARRPRPPQRQEVAQPLGDRRGVAVRAPIGLVAPARHVVQLQELDDPVPAEAEQRVEAPRQPRHRRPIRWEPLDQRVERQFDHHDRRRLQRLQEPRRQSDRDAVARPEPLAVRGAEGQPPERQVGGAHVRRRPRDVAAQRLRRRVVAQEAARVDAADPAPFGQPDVPDPSGRMRRRDRL